MTCYFHHLSGVFEEAGIEVTRENRKELDKIIQNLVGGDTDCPAVWRKVKERLAKDEAGFVADLNSAWRNRSPV